jgi:hypothetical protein
MSRFSSGRKPYGGEAVRREGPRSQRLRQEKQVLLQVIETLKV